MNHSVPPSKKLKIIALLPMKANSNRVKGKNFREFCGKPLFRWTLDSLLKVNLIDEIVINTDARHILEKYKLPDSRKIVIRDREEKLCGDNVSMNRVIKNDLDNTDADIYIMTHTTNPLLGKKTIESGLMKFLKSQNQKHKVDSLFTVNKVQTRFYRANGSAVNHNPDKLIPTQDIEPWYEENSNLYIFTKESFRKTSSRIGRKPIMMETSKAESVDIDTQEDWDIAERIARYNKENDDPIA